MLKKRFIVRDAKYDLVDDACWKWFSQQRSKGAPVSGPLMQEKALSFFQKLYPDADPESFKAEALQQLPWNLKCTTSW